MDDLLDTSWGLNENGMTGFLSTSCLALAPIWLKGASALSITSQGTCPSRAVSFISFLLFLFSRMLSDSDSDSDATDLHTLTINEHYAKAFEYRKEREELERRESGSLLLSRLNRPS
jgi:hypothetical protein